MQTAVLTPQDLNSESAISPIQTSLPTPVLVLDEFLVAQEWNSLMRYTLENAATFQTTRVLDAAGHDQLDQQHRRSRVLFHIGYFDALFAARLLTFFPYILSRLRFPYFPISRAEIQLTASNHGEYFKRHTDSGSAAVQSRTLTFVYFFYREPKPFTGGELRIFNRPSAGQPVDETSFCTIEPAQNQIVFFESDLLHEILPIHCPSQDFADSRFTVNGWFHR